MPITVNKYSYTLLVIAEMYAVATAYRCFLLSMPAIATDVVRAFSCLSVFCTVKVKWLEIINVEVDRQPHI